MILSGTYDWTKNHGRVDGRDRKVWLLLLNEIPRGFLGQGFAGTVALQWVLLSLFRCDVIPIILGVGVAWPEALASIYYCSEGRSDYDVLD